MTNMKIEELRRMRAHMEAHQRPKLYVKGEAYYVLGEDWTPDRIEAVQREIDRQECEELCDCRPGAWIAVHDHPRLTLVERLRRWFAR